MIIARREFFRLALVFLGGGGILRAMQTREKKSLKQRSPVVISTWPHGVSANESAWRVLRGGGSSLDAVEQGVRISEGDPEVMTVGYGGLPNEEGIVQLDAAIMWGPKHDAGAVGALEGIKHPISVARLVMERSDHVFLVGDGALKFARAHGFQEEDLLTEKARKRWLRWKEGLSSEDDWVPAAEGTHDTIGMVALDKAGNLAGACTTSGLAYKLSGRVGDSPIIGHGMYVDNNVGAAAGTGRGEAMMKACGAFLAVEYMRQGTRPEEACKKVLRRIIDQHPEGIAFQDALVAVNKEGEVGAASLQDGFEYAVHTRQGNRLFSSPFLLEASPRDPKKGA